MNGHSGDTTASRQIASLERRLGEDGLHLAAHAALPVALTPELVNLIRINFLQEPKRPVPYSVEARLLLSSLCREVDSDLFEIDSDTRTHLLSILAETFGPNRIREVASLLLQYTRKASPWVDRPALEAAQELTARNFIDPLSAQLWLEQAALGTGAEQVDHQWYIAMRREMSRGQVAATPVSVAEPSDPAVLYEALSRLNFEAQLRIFGEQTSGPNPRIPAFLINGPPGHGQQWLCNLMIQRLPPAEVVSLAAGPPLVSDGTVLMATRSGKAWAWEDADPVALMDRYRGMNVVILIQRADLVNRGTLDDLLTAIWANTPFTDRRSVHVFMLAEGDVAILSSILDPFVVRLPPLLPFDRAVLVAWLRDNADYLPPELTSDAERTVTTILEGSDGGLPDLALRYVASLCGVPWPEIELLAEPAAAYAPLGAGLANVPPELLVLIREYDATRASMARGPDRTRALEAVVSKMRLIKPAPALIEVLTAGQTAGARLLAVAMLQQDPDPSYLSWLADRLRQERPFVGYHAAVALERAADRLDESFLDEILAAIQRGRASLRSDPRAQDRAGPLDRAQAAIAIRRSEFAEKRKRDRPGKKEPERPPRRVARAPLPLWNPGRRLKVKFLDGDRYSQDLVRRIAPAWTQGTSISFDFLSSDSTESAEIRVSFAQPGSWSYVGADALSVPMTEPTLNLGYDSTTISEEDASRTILHEFGHVMGLFEEHQSPNANIPWNEAALYDALSRPPNNWGREQVERSFLTKYAFDSTEYRPFDRDSVMLLKMSKSWTDLDTDIGGASTLSASDLEFVQRLYPVQGAPRVADSRETEFDDRQEPRSADEDVSRDVRDSDTRVAETTRVLRRFVPARTLRVAANVTVVAFRPSQPPKVAKRMLFARAAGAKFDAVVAFDPAATLDDPGSTFLRVTSGAFAGLYIPLSASGVSADISADGMTSPDAESTFGAAGVAPPPEAESASEREASDAIERVDSNLDALAARLGELYAKVAGRGESPEAEQLVRAFIRANRQLVTIAIRTVLGMSVTERERLYRRHPNVLTQPAGAFPEYVSDAVDWAEMKPGQALVGFDDDRVNVLRRVVHYAKYVANTKEYPPPIHHDDA